MVGRVRGRGVVRLSGKERRDSVLCRENLDKAYPTSRNDRGEVATKKSAKSKGPINFTKDSVPRRE